MKNLRSAMTKQIKNADSVFAKRIGTDVYVWTSYWALKTNVFYYDTEIRPHNMKLLKLDDGDSIESNGKKAQCEATAHDMHPEKLFTNDFDIHVFFTPLKIVLDEYHNTKKGVEARIFKGDKTHWIINDDYVKMAEELDMKKVMAGSEMSSNPLMFMNDVEKLMILPIAIPSKAYEWIDRI